MNPSRPFILRPVATSLLMVALLLAGFVAYRVLPISALPEVDYPTIQVTTLYPGASPDVTTSSITAPLERQFGQMPGLNQMSSISSGGASVITLQFKLSLGLDVAEQEVQAAINASGSFLPTDLPNPPMYSKVNPADTPVMTLAVTSTSLPLPQVEDLVDTRLAQKLSQVPGVGLVSLSGGQRPAVRVQVNQKALASLGVSIENVRTAIGQQNVNEAKGTVSSPLHASTLDTNDQIKTAAEYRDLVIAYRDGAPVRLSDVAEVIDSAENTHLAAWANETPAIIVNIQRQPGANVIAVVNRIRHLLPQLQATIPGSIQVQLLSDRTTTIRASVRDVQFELMLSVALVVMVMFLFLRNLSATVIPSVAVPLSLIGTFGVMYLAGFSINNLTLMALTIATGFVVDDAIVMIENIARYLEAGDAPLQAALKGAKQIGFTIISLTVSLIAVLIPLLFMSDVVGRLFRQFAITLAASILISAFVSLTLTPMMCARLLHHVPEDQQGRFYHATGRLFERIINGYGRMLNWVLDRQPLMLLAAVATLALTAYLYVIVPKGFFPLQDTGQIQGITQAEQSISFPAMAERQQTLAQLILQDPDVNSLSSFIGVDGINTTLNSGRMLINLIPRDQRKDDIQTTMRRLQRKLAAVPGITLYMQPVQDLTIEDRVSPTQYQFVLQGTSQNDLSTWAPRLVARLQQLPQLAGVASDLQDKGLQAYIDIDRDTAGRLGITTAEIDNALYDAFGQRLISTIFTQSNQYRVVLEVQPKFQIGPDALSGIYVPVSGTAAVNNSGVAPTGSTPVVSSPGVISAGTTALAGGSGSASTTGNAATAPTAAISTLAGNSAIAANGSISRQVPLNDIATIRQQEGPLAIDHQGQFPATVISFNLAPGASLGQAVAAIQAAEQELRLPARMQTSFQGAAASFQASLGNELWLILAAVVTVYIVLGVLYESYIHPITILSTLPSAGVGALLALMLTGTDLGVIAIIGIVLLIGIVKKNAIMMIDFALEAEREGGKAPREAIFQAALLRFRPILMTTLAALLGALPLMLGRGVGSELRHPLGLTMVGGLIVSQMLTLFTTPVIYLAFDRLAGRVQRRRAQPGKAASGSAPP